MHKLLFDIPTRIETERLYLRCYQPGDGRWYYPMSRRNKAHLARYEAGNAALTITTQDNAEIVMRQFAAAWLARDAFFMGAFDKSTDEFVAQIYIGPGNWELPEFSIGYFVDLAHEGRGYVTEAVTGVLGMLFEELRAHRVWLECDETNLRSARVAERCGMTREGHLRQNKKRPDGTFGGTLLYAILRWEYAAGE